MKDAVVVARIALGCLAWALAMGGFVSAVVDPMPHINCSIHLIACGVWALVGMKAWEPLRW